MDIEDALMKVIWKRREAFYAEAVEQGIISKEQAAKLIVLHASRDTEQKRRETLEVEAPPCEAYVMHGPGHQSRTKCRIKGPHRYHYADDPMSPAWEWETKVASLDYDGRLREIPDD